MPVLLLERLERLFRWKVKNMTKEELETKVREQCPAMLEHKNFMHAAECVFCKGIPNDSGKSLTSDELVAWHKMNTATVAQVIEHL